MKNPYDLSELRKIYDRVGGENGGKPYYEFFRAIDNNEIDEHQALIRLVIQLARQNEELVKVNMRMAESLYFV